VGISLSGGLDSSSLFCIAKSRKAEPPDATPYIIGAYMNYDVDSPADERAHIDAIEQHYGVTVSRIDAKGFSYFAHGLEPVSQSEVPISEIGWGVARNMLKHFASRGAKVVLTGHWGDQVLFEQRYLLDLLHQLKLKTLFKHLFEYARWYQDTDANYFRRQFYRDALKSALPPVLLAAARATRRRYARMPGEHIYTKHFVNRASKQRATRNRETARCSEHALAIYMQIRSRAYQVALDASNKAANFSGLEFAYPYLDRELLEFLMAAPGDAITTDGVPKGVLRNALADCMPQSIRNRNWKADSTYIEYAAFREQLPAIRDYVLHTRAVYDHAIAVRPGVEKELEKEFFAAANATQPIDRFAWSIEYFLGACQWLEAFDFQAT